MNSATGLSEAFGIAVSPDGESVYVTSLQDGSLVRLERDTTTGALGFGECFTHNIEVRTPCRGDPRQFQPPRPRRRRAGRRQPRRQERLRGGARRKRGRRLRPAGGGSSHDLTVVKAGSGSGTVTSSPAGIECGAACVDTFIDGTKVALTAAPTAGSSFSGWSGAGCSGAGGCEVTLSADTTLTSTIAAGGSGGGPPVVGSGCTPKPLKCRKGFKKELVKGNAKCVKAKKHHARSAPHRRSAG